MRLGPQHRTPCVYIYIYKQLCLLQNNKLCLNEKQRWREPLCTALCVLANLSRQLVDNRGSSASISSLWPSRLHKSVCVLTLLRPSSSWHPPCIACFLVQHLLHLSSTQALLSAADFGVLWLQCSFEFVTVPWVNRELAEPVPCGRWAPALTKRKTWDQNELHHEHLSLCPPVHIHYSMSFNQSSLYTAMPLFLSICFFVWLSVFAYGCQVRDHKQSAQGLMCMGSDQSQ